MKYKKKKMESDRGKHEEDGDSAALCSIFLKRFCSKLHHLNHIFALLPVPSVSPVAPSFPSSPSLLMPRPRSPGAATFRGHFFRTTTMTHPSWILFGNAAVGRIQGEKAVLRCRQVWNEGITSTSVFGLVSFKSLPRFSRRPPEPVRHRPRSVQPLSRFSRP